MTFAFLIVWFICFFKVSGSGMPGVGVAPFGTGVLPMVFGSGMPGVGVVPVGIRLTLTVLGSGMPGVELPLGVTGLFENSGGILVAELELLTVLPPGAFAEVQAETIATRKIKVTSSSFFISNKILEIFKI